MHLSNKPYGIAVMKFVSRYLLVCKCTATSHFFRQLCKPGETVEDARSERRDDVVVEVSGP